MRFGGTSSEEAARYRDLLRLLFTLRHILQRSAPVSAAPKALCSRNRQGHPESFDEGTEIVEFSLVIIPMLGLVFLIMNVAWMIFAKATLQEAVREGVRFGVTGQVIIGQAGVSSSIRQVVQQYSEGFISASNASSEITIQYLSPQTLTPVTGVTSCEGGNVLQVTASNVSVSCRRRRRRCHELRCSRLMLLLLAR